MQLTEMVDKLRIRICQYRILKTGAAEISTHLNAADIVLSLVDLAIKDKRPISKEEENWFRAGYYLSLVFAGSEWEDIQIEFDKIADLVEKAKFFRV
ncbi:MAG: hypothetical protein JNM88_21590 [Chitinophagaceae bacterium]|nr:hypothetical protein [Chitinophagaceae bacterium]